MNKIIFLTIISFSFCDYSGGYAGSSLKFGASAREISLSNSMVSTNNPGFNGFSNPAFVSTIQGPQLGSSIFLLSGDRNLQVISYYRQLPPQAGAGISFYRTGVTNIIGINSDEFVSGPLEYSDGYIMLSFGINFNKFLSVGFNIKPLFQKFVISDNQDYSSKGIALDIGIASSPIEKINIGIKLENAIGEYNWNQNISDNSIPYKEKIPINLILGGSYSYSKSLLILLQDEITFIPDNDLEQRLSAGMEYQIGNHFPMLIRFGIRQSRWLNDGGITINELIKPSVGFGIKYKIMNKFLLNLDYAIQFDEVGMNNLFSISTEI